MFYFIMLLIMTMFTLNPVIITVSFVMALFGVLRHKGTGALKMTAMLFVPIMLFSVIILPIFNHNGVTPLFLCKRYGSNIGKYYIWIVYDNNAHGGVTVVCNGRMHDRLRKNTIYNRKNIT